MSLILDIFLFMMLISLLNLARYMFKIRKVIKMNKDNPNMKGISIVNGEIKVIEENEVFPPVGTKEVEEHLVTDPICGKQLEKKDAYRILKEGKEYFFCSWECREKFLADNK